MNQLSTPGSSPLSIVLGSVTAAGLWASRARAYRFPDGAAGEGLADSGQVDLTTRIAVTGAEGIEAMMAPLDKDSPYFGTEKRAAIAIITDQALHVLLNGYFPTIESSMSLTVWPEDGAEADGESFDIIVVDHDSQRIMTRLAVRRYTY